MSDDAILRYNYDEFTREKFEPLMRFDASPDVGTTGPDFPLWTLEGVETTLSAQWSQHKFLIVEFGSFT